MKFAKHELPLRTTLLYLLFGGLWILLSDLILSFLIFDNPQQTIYQMLKGWFFILISALLLYILLRKDFEGLRRYELLSEHGRDLILFVRIEDGRVLDANAAARHAYGYSRNEMLALTIQDLRAPHTLSLTTEQMAQADAEGILFETVHLRKDGSTFPVEVSSRGTTLGGGRVLVSIIRDITERKQAAQELAGLSKFPAENPYPVLRVQNNGCLLYANHASQDLLEMWGCKLNEVLPKEWVELIRATVESCTNRTIEIFCKNRVYSIILVPILEGSYVNLYARDITERKWAEEEVQRSEAMLRAVLDQMPSGVTVRDAQSGGLLLSNARSQEIMGALVDSADQFTQYRGFHMDGRPYQTQDWPLSRSMAAGEVVHAEELTYQRRDGTRITLSINSAPVRDPQGEILLGVAVFDDITRRKQAEDYIRYQARLLENVSDAIIASDMEGRITSWNTAAEQIYGWHADDVIGEFADDSLHTQYEAGVTKDQVLQCFLEAGQWKGEITQQRRDGESITVLASVSVMRDKAGNPIAMLTVNRDISARKRAEEKLRSLLIDLEQRVLERTAQLNQTNQELEHANHAKDEFLANMSHELRTPLNSILGMSEILLEERRGFLNEYQRKSLELVESSGHHLLELINDILDLSKIEAGKLDYYPQPINVDELCRSSLAFIKAQAAKKSITVNYSNRASVPRILADSRRLKQVLVNLLSNAVKFTPDKGEVTLQVSTELEQERIQFSVIDTGIGIAQKDMQRLFQPFAQVDSSLNRQYEGTGLGLALVQKLIDLHGGSIHVESDGVPGRGSRFTVNLSCKAENIPGGENPNLSQYPASIAENNSNSFKVSAQKGHVLLAEDNLSNVLTIGEYLKSYGYQVSVAHDGLEAIAMAEEVAPDLILMDIQMPAMNGLEAIAHLRANPQFVATPIVAITALAMAGDRERCLQAGASEYMSKPVSLKTLRQTIDNLI